MNYGGQREIRSPDALDALEQLGVSGANAGVCLGPGLWLTGESRFSCVNPTTGKSIATVCEATAGDYESVITNAETAFEAWRAVPAPKRSEVVWAIGAALRENKDALGTLIALETGKIKQEGDGEVQEAIDIADFAVGQSRMLYGRTMHSERPHHRMYEQWHPLGVVGVITAFNFPLAVWAWNAFIAAVCGDVVVWKPSPKAPLTAIAVQHILNRVLEETGHSGMFSLFVTRSREIAQRFVADRRVLLVSFTGSSAVGRQVGEAVARRMGKVILECSGNNAVIVDETANLDLAVRAIVFGAVGTAGQRCTTTRRVIVHESRREELTRRLVEAYRQVKVGDPLDPATLMGPLIDKEAVEAFRGAMEEIKAAGGAILHGGDVIGGPGCFVQPTLVAARNHWDIVQRETFAPILYLIPYRTPDEAIALNNGVRQGLSSSLFTENLRHAEQFLSAVGSDCGIANVNIGTSGAEIGGAFGGEKETGGGREAGSDAWKAYMRRQTNTINWGTDLPLAQGIKFDVGKDR
ncbi:MAG: aldehyde dehydrogenase family protein [Betaproteobacteria bacterium]|nr:aldehyde dehydrogenase family protein [Betaproteobacteria bacterium]